ncbi:UNVERIFIED_CONTAM: cytochrome c oxidase subunit 1 [Siphonaria sp. JEL0065]|nr:cytochrome c oxidase subunit 1 [Siphonaria sp. JEL0065]
MMEKVQLLNELRSGVFVCKVMNLIQPALITLGVPRKQIFRPLEFLQGNPKGDESFLKNILQLSILVHEKGSVPDPPSFNFSTANNALESVLQASLSGASSLASLVATDAPIPPVPAIPTSAQLSEALLQSVSSSRNPGTIASAQLSDAPSVSPTSTVTTQEPVHHQFLPHDPLHHPHRSSSFTASPTASPLSLQQQHPQPNSSKQKILEKLNSIDTSLSTTLKETRNNLNKIQAGHLALAEEIFQHLEALSKRVAAMESVQKRLSTTTAAVTPASTVQGIPESPVRRRSRLNTGGAGNGPHLRSSTELSNGSLRSDDETGSIGGKSVGSPPATPKLFPKLPQEVLNMGLPKQDLMRLSVVYELIETEADYVRDLGIMVDLHQREMLNSKILDDITVSTIFSNVEDLISANSGLLEKLIAKRDENLVINQLADVFLESTHTSVWAEAYTIYCSNYPLAMKIVTKLMTDDKVKAVMQSLAANPVARGLSLESFLIKPVQRICKYPLLLRELLKHSAKTMPDYPELEKALESMESLAAKVNEATQALEKKERLAALLSRIESSVPLPFHDKKLIMEGITQMQKNKERHLIMFKDVLVVSKVIGKGKYSLESLYNMHELVLVKANVHGERKEIEYEMRRERMTNYFRSSRRSNAPRR